MSIAEKAQQKNGTETEALGGFTVVGITTRTTNRDGNAAQDINALWLKFFEEAVGERIPAKDGEAIYAIYHSYEGDHNAPYALTIGCRATAGRNDFSLPEGLDSVFVESGDYMIFAATGEQPKALIDTWQSIWKSDLNRAFKTDVEIYGPRFFEEGVHEILVCVGIDSNAPLSPVLPA